MTTNILSDKWRGQRADPIDPTTIRFTAKESIGCAGCLFHKQSYTVCDKAYDIAAISGIPACSTDDREYIYVLDKSDPRQMAIGMVEQGEAA